MGKENTFFEVKIPIDKNFTEEDVSKLKKLWKHYGEDKLGECIGAILKDVIKKTERKP